LQKVRLELALEEVAEREGLTVSDTEVDEAVSRAVSDDPTLARPDELRSADPVRAYFRHQLLMRKTIDHLSALASGESSATIGAPVAAGAPLEAVEVAGTPGPGTSGTEEERK
jgi:FKBP-type peptidyl-prolyl cis-trans isomerase (trigger factor)